MTTDADNPIRGLTVCQPYAHLISIGAKLTEYRTWSRHYRGPLVIHAGKSRRWLRLEPLYNGMVFGAVVAVADLVNCARPLRDADGDTYSWMLANVRRLREPIPWPGKRGLWRVPPELRARIEQQLGEPI